MVGFFVYILVWCLILVDTLDFGGQFGLDDLFKTLSLKRLLLHPMLGVSYRTLSDQSDL